MSNYTTLIVVLSVILAAIQVRRQSCAILTKFILNAITLISSIVDGQLYIQ